MVMQGTDMKVAETPTGQLEDFRIPDAYEDWLEKEGGDGPQDLLRPQLARGRGRPLGAQGGEGAVIHIDNAHMPNDLHVVDIAPGGRSEPEHHMYEINFYIVSGRGATTVWMDESSKQTFEWRTGSLFTIPLNAWYQHFNGSGDEKVRYMATTNAPPMMRLFRDTDFMFNNDFMFRSRYTDDESWFSGNGSSTTAHLGDELHPQRPGHGALRMEGARRRRHQRHAADGPERHGQPYLRVPIGTYKKAHRHGPGAHLFLLSGDAGYSSFGRRKTAPTW